MTVLPADNLSVGINKIVLVSGGIIVPTTCDSRPISFSNELSQMDFVGHLMICMYFRDDPAVGSMTTLA